MSTNNELLAQEREALDALNNLLSFNTAEVYITDVKELFNAFLMSDLADEQDTRIRILFTFEELMTFLAAVHSLPLIDRFRN